MLFFVAVNVFLLGFVQQAISTPCKDKIKECGGGGGSISGFSESMQSSMSQSSSCASSMYESSSSSCSKSISSGSSCNSFDESYWIKIFEQCSCISEVERQCYLKWLPMFPDECLKQYTSIAEYFSIKEALSSDILDYTLLQKDIMSAYEFFNTNGLYCTDVELSTKIAIFEEYKSKLSQTLSCLGQGRPLYNILKYSIESDITSLPCTIGFLNSIVKSQESYFSSSSSSSSYSSRSIESSKTSSSGCSSASVSSTGSSTTVDVSQYESIFQTASIQSTESSVYLSYLSKLSSDKICLFTDLINYLNQDTQVLTAEMILDFTSFNQEIQSIYQSLSAQEFFIQNADWLAKEAILTEIKSKMSSAVSFLSKDCSMYRALQYCLNDVSYIPLFVGLNYYLLQQQSSYFSSSSCSSSVTTSCTSSSSSGCSSVCV